MSETIEIKHGQIWQEMDPRVERFIRIEGMPAGDSGKVVAMTVVRGGDGKWSRPYWVNRHTTIAARRFNGKSRGYKLFEDVTP